MRVLVCGSRTWRHGQVLHALLAGLRWVVDPEPVTVLQGGARGADRYAEIWARAYGVQCVPYPADWDTHGRSAGPVRNQRMLSEGEPDLVVAFVDKPLTESRGTADMVRRAARAGVPTYVVRCVVDDRGLGRAGAELGTAPARPPTAAAHRPRCEQGGHRGVTV